jgi:hypothetical protein
MWLLTREKKKDEIKHRETKRIEGGELPAGSLIPQGRRIVGQHCAGIS